MTPKASGTISQIHLVNTPNNFPSVMPNNKKEDTMNIVENKSFQKKGLSLTSSSLNFQ